MTSNPSKLSVDNGYSWNSSPTKAKLAVESALQIVVWDGSPRGFKPHRHLTDEQLAALKLAVDLDALTTPSRGWGYRLTASGRAMLAVVAEREAARHAKIREAGFDPSQKLADMSPEQIERFIAAMGLAK